MLRIIVAMANGAVIGKDNRMPWHIPEDLAYFKHTTMGHPVIMGKNTYFSIGKALPGRENIVLSRSRDFHLPDAKVYHDLKSAMRDYPNAFVIGGAEIFRQALPYAKQLYITHIDKDIAGDTRFDDLDLSAYKCIYCENKISADGNYPLRFCIYEPLD